MPCRTYLPHPTSRDAKPGARVRAPGAQLPHGASAHACNYDLMSGWNMRQKSAGCAVCGGCESCGAWVRTVGALRVCVPSVRSWVRGFVRGCVVRTVGAWVRVRAWFVSGLRAALCRETKSEGCATCKTLSEKSTTCI